MSTATATANVASPIRQDWLDGRIEAILEPNLAIVDPRAYAFWGTGMPRREKAAGRLPP